MFLKTIILSIFILISFGCSESSSDVSGLISNPTLDESNGDSGDISIVSVVLPANGTYGESGEVIFQINFDSQVYVSGATPRLLINIGGNLRYANYATGSGTSGLEFKYIIQNGDNDTDGIVLDQDTILLSGSTLSGSESQTVQRLFSGLYTPLTGVLVNTNLTAPNQVVNVTIAPSNSSDTLSVTWSTPQNNGSAITHYIVQYRQKGLVSWSTLTPNPTNNSAKISALLSETTYEIRVAANNGVIGAYSDIGEAEIFNVLDLNPIAWLDATNLNGDNTTPADGSNVSSWVDISGVATSATEPNITNQPVFKHNVQNGLPSVRFENKDRGLEGSFNRVSNGGLTMFIVGSFDAGYSDKCIFEFHDGSNARAFFIDRRYASNTYFSPAITKGQFKVWRVLDTGSNSSVWENTNRIADNFTNAFDTSFTGTGFYVLGDDKTGGNRMYGHIGEFLVFDGQLSQTDIDKIENYLNNKWNLQF